MLDIVLYEPEIPPNTGNLIRLAANSGSRLHLVKPLGFSLSERALKRSGLDYGALASVTVHEDWSACRSHFAGRNCYAVTTRGVRCYADVAYARDDVVVFGPETRGLPAEVLGQFPDENRLRLPMAAGNRSLNLANAVSIVVYEAWRQADFVGGA
ncbi:MAG TPA: tRNA (cytidine(34)-2'-O)-methyltransferase [Burkholderiales bacterium]|nr:tRNA (cytidine(34)-2'-O)-methyltransferase [Burkholderiales bacterium]